MTGLRIIPRQAFAGLLMLAFGAASCAPGPKPRPPSPRPLSLESRQKIDQEYYHAVQAYLGADYAQARARIVVILALDPKHAAALELRRRVAAAEKLSVPPGPGP